MLPMATINTWSSAQQGGSDRHTSNSVGDPGGRLDVEDEVRLYKYTCSKQLRCSNGTLPFHLAPTFTFLREKYARHLESLLPDMRKGRLFVGRPS